MIEEGGKVLYHPASEFEGKCKGGPLNAVVAKKWSPGCVDLNITDDDGKSHSRLFVTVLSDGDKIMPPNGFCEEAP